MYNYENIPAEMRETKRWVLWRRIQQLDGRATKIPVNANNGYGAKSNDPNTWTTYDVALSRLDHYNCAGLGFMLGDGYFGVDIDHAIDNEELISEFVDSLKSYTEKSQSGEGIHIICKGTLPTGNRRKGNIEMYDTTRFFALTGNIINNYTLSDRTQEVIPLWNKYLNDNRQNNTPVGAYIYERPNNPFQVSANLTDDEVIKYANNSKNGILFNALLCGNWEGIYPSQSEADMSFCNLLAFWTGRNATQMDRIVRNSGLYREKWDRKTGQATYGENTINIAISNCKDIYTGKKEVITQYNEQVDKVRDLFKENKETKKYDLNDTGNAERFIDTYGEDIRYNHENKYWVIWNGKTWVRDATQLVKTKVDELIEKMKEEVINEQNEKYAQELLKNVKHLSNNGGKEAMLKEAMHIGRTPTINADYDIDKYLLNCENGVVNLKTGELLPHDRKYMMSKNTHIYIDLENEPIIWKKFVSDIFSGSKGLVNYIHKAVGYSLTGDVKEQCFFQCYGTGSNGKSVFFNSIYNMLGDYVVNAQVESVLSRGGTMGGNANPDIARLKGARFVRTNEPNENAKFNEGLVKQLTGGDPITARFLYGSEFEFKPIFKLWIASNYKINVYGTDKGIWRRMRLIPFEACFEGKNDDKDLEKKLMSELPQILGWAVKGCIKWINEGLEIPDEIEEATTLYRTEMDIIEKFSINCLKKNRSGKERSTDLFEEYVRWAKASNEPFKMSQTKFGIEMSKKYPKKVLNGATYYLGITLLKHDESYVYEKER